MAPTTTTLTIAGHELTLEVGDDAFQPTTVTHKLAEIVDLKPGCKVLDLGCGVGPLGIWAALAGAGSVTSIDVMPTACAHARKNVERAGVADKVTVLCGDLFEPVKGRKFDIIVNDVSGIAERAARISPWYPPIIPSGGEDGTDVVIRMFDQAPAHLEPGGSLYFATSTLSNAAKIVEHANRVFDGKVERLGSQRIPFCAELVAGIEELEQLRQQGKVSFENRRSRYLWTLDVFRCGPMPG